MEMTLRGENFELAELEAVVSLLAGPGMIQRLDFCGFILLRPEVLSRYAVAVVRKVRKHPQELGCIREDELLAGDLDYQDFKRLPREDEAVVLRTLLERFGQPGRAKENSPAIYRWVPGRRGNESRQGRKKLSATLLVISFAPTGLG